LDLTERIATSLYASGQYEKAGELFQRVKLVDKAMDAFKKGNVYSSAVELARVSYPEEVIKLEEHWGDYLASNRQLDSSINHFIESGNMIKAIEAAIGSKQVSF
jgi:intraflagellar transport protein 172